HHVVDQESAVPVVVKIIDRFLDRQEIENFARKEGEQFIEQPGNEQQATLPGAAEAIQAALRRRRQPLPPLPRNHPHHTPLEELLENKVHQRKGDKRRQPGKGSVGINTPVKGSWVALHGGSLPEWGRMCNCGRRGDWRLETGDWRLEIGDWRLTFHVHNL